MSSTRYHYALLKNISVIILALGFATLSPAQTGPVYQPIREDSATRQACIDILNKRYDADVKSIEGKNKKYISDIYKERVDYIIDRFHEKDPIIAGKEQAYLNRIVDKIIKANLRLQGINQHIYFSRDYWPNAYSTGEGSIFFNIGLFHKMSSEAQLVFVLCHELAHYYLDHGNKSIEQYVNTVYSDEFQKKLKEIKKTEYQKREAFENLTKGFAFKSRRHSREYESQADSMALEFMKNTDFDLSESMTCMALLDTADTDKYNFELNLQRTFNFQAYAFKSSWLEQEDLLTMTAEKNKKEEDSLKTHPDCKIRIGKLSDQIRKINKPGGRKFLSDATEFESLKSAFDLEIIEYCFQSGQISRALYFSLEMLNHYPDNPYLHAMVGRCLNQFYIYQKNHELNKIVDLPSNDHKKNYNDLLHFIGNLRLTEIAALSYYYLQQFESKDQNNEYFVAALIDSKVNYNKPDERSQWISFFKKNFPSSSSKF